MTFWIIEQRDKEKSYKILDLKLGEYQEKPEEKFLFFLYVFLELCYKIGRRKVKGYLSVKIEFDSYKFHERE
ncbi:MAG: hypothetical protein D6805_01535 [Planctomycetota bacterium]|nr:MAG: hypothetical protein D6805_01535 [Planctomycetota bacterium]